MRYRKFFDVGDVGMGQVIIAGVTYTEPGVAVEEAPTSIWGKLAEMTKNVVDGLKQKLPEIGSSALTALATSKINERIFGETSPDRVAAAAPPAIPAAPPPPKAGVPGWVWPVAAVGVLGLGFVALKGRKRGKRR